MIELSGKYNSCKVFTDNIDTATNEQIITLMNQPSFAKSKVRIMPDCHAGEGCVIGTTMTITDKIVPNLVGVDIACSVTVIQLHQKDVDLKKLDDAIHKLIPAGINVRTNPHPYIEHVPLQNLYAPIGDMDHIQNSLGTLGGGNHYLELDRDDNGYLYFCIHTGSRKLGVQIANYYQTKANKQTQYKPYNEKITKIITDLKAQGRFSEIQTEIEKFRNEYQPDKKIFGYCTDELMEQYLHDVRIAQDFAFYNHSAISNILFEAMNWTSNGAFITRHNYIDLGNMILRKGAVSARKGEQIIIPMNMRDGSLICTGKGNDDWNQSAPHGAGRIMSRAKARQNLNMEDFTKSMEGIFTTSVSEETIDESPMAYKPMKDIIKFIEPTVTVNKIIKPIYNFKAGSDS